MHDVDAQLMVITDVFNGQLRLKLIDQDNKQLLAVNLSSAFIDQILLEIYRRAKVERTLNCYFLLTICFCLIRQIMIIG